MNGSEAHCHRCGKDFSNIVDKTWSVVYDKCRGQKCPKCKKIRTLAAVEITYFSLGARADGCPRCKKKSIPVLKNGLCPDCFWGTEEEKGCICVLDDFTAGMYCSFCREVHYFRPACKECLERQDWLFQAQQGKLSWFHNPKNLWVALPVVLVVGIIIGFITAKIILKKKSSKKNKPVA